MVFFVDASMIAKVIFTVEELPAMIAGYEQSCIWQLSLEIMN